MKKSYILLILALAFSCCFAFFACDALRVRRNEQGLEFCLNEDKNTYSLYAVGTCTEEDLTIPSTFNGKKVTSIDACAFTGCVFLRSVTISDGLTYIGNAAFEQCPNLISVSMSDSVKSMGNSVFYHCTAWSAITLSKNLTLIPEKTFLDCESLASVEIPDGVTDIGEEAFRSCGGLISAVIPSSVTKIGERAFWRCGALTSISIPEGVESIEEETFYECKELRSVVFPDQVTSIGENAFDGCDALIFNEYDNACYLGNEKNPYRLLMKAKSTDIVSCEVKEGAYYIYNNAFANCGSLTSITLPESLRYIGKGAVSYCHKLVEICKKSPLTIAKGNATNIGYWAKNICTSEEEKRVSTTEDGYVFYEEEGERLFLGYVGSEKALVLPADITGVYQYAFNDRVDITAVTVPIGVKDIAKNAFNGCVGLQIIVYEGTVLQWQSVAEGIDFGNHTINCTIRCADDSIEIHTNKVSGLDPVFIVSEDIPFSAVEYCDGKTIEYGTVTMLD